MSQQEIKGALAKLLATENLTVEHTKCETASFDVKNRVLSLPLWIASESVYDMLVGHEVGHALYTPAEEWTDMLNVPQSYVNILEDVRIEKAMKEKFPGLRKDFFQGYKELNEKDFFGIEILDLEKLKLIDRINLHYKVGIVDHTKPIPFFSDEENEWVALADKCETFDDVTDLARRIFEWQGEQNEKQEEIDNAPSTEDEGFSGKQMDQMKTEVGDKEEEEGQADVPNTMNQRGESDREESDEFDDMPDQSNEGGFEYNDGVTDKNFADNLKDIADTNDYNNPTYCDVPDVNLNHLIVKPEVWLTGLKEFWNNDVYTDPDHKDYVGIDFSKVDAKYAAFKKKSNQEVNYMVKEFECKKAATAYARASVSKTGVLDTTKLFQYRYNDDIFKKITSTPDGKSHGLIFLLDWSGSMCSQLQQTVKQLLSLAQFCRKVKIPFVVYSFSDSYWEYRDPEAPYRSRDNDYAAYKNAPKAGEFSIYTQLRLIQLLDSDANKATFDEQAHMLFRLGAHFENRYDHWGYNYPIPPNMNLGGTPLNDSLVCLKTIIPTFKAKYGVEKLHVVTLTDGESNTIGVLQQPRYDYDTGLYRGGVHGAAVVRDRKLGYHSKASRDSHSGMTTILLSYLKNRFPESNFIGFRVISGQDCGHFLKWNVSTNQEIDYDAKMKQWRKDKSLCLRNTNGYQELFLLNQKTMNVETEFEVKQDATNAQIRTAFKKSLGAKANNKKVLTNFITQIA